MNEQGQDDKEQARPASPEAEAYCTETAQADRRQDREHHAEKTEKPQGWQPIETAPLDGSVVLVWDEEVSPYPITAFWYREPVYKKEKKGKILDLRNPISYKRRILALCGRRFAEFCLELRWSCS